MLGLVTTKRPALETPEELIRSIREAGRYIALERLALIRSARLSSSQDLWSFFSEHVVRDFVEERFQILTKLEYDRQYGERNTTDNETVFNRRSTCGRAPKRICPARNRPPMTALASTGDRVIRAIVSLSHFDA